MAVWYEVFDNEQVQLITRRRVAALGAVLMVSGAVTLGLLSLGGDGRWAAVGGVLAVGWGVCLALCARRWRRLRRVVWCVKLSEDDLVGYDYTRRKTTIAWQDVRGVALHAQGLLVQGPDAVSLDVPHLFPDYAAVSHRILYYAERYGLPVLIDGRPWEDLDVYALYPFLERSPTGGAAHGRA